MKDSLTRNATPSQGIPEDLAIFESRMRHHGVGVTLPTVGEGFEFTEVWEIEGEPLSETVVRRRRGE